MTRCDTISKEKYFFKGCSGGGGKIGLDGKQAEAGGGHKGQEELHCYRPGDGFITIR